MSQRNVERVIGRLVTDEGFRRRFFENPTGVLRDITCCGLELTDIEVGCLAKIDPRLPSRFAEALDARIQKLDLATASGEELS